MEVCDACGSNSYLPETLGSLTLCKKCALRIFAPNLRRKVYTTNAQVIQQRDTTMRTAARSGFSQPALQKLYDYFNSLIIDGLVRAFDGGMGQHLVVFEDHCVISAQDGFDQESVRKKSIGRC